MNVSGFTIVRNATQYHYPVIESIRSILPICDEYIVNVGKSDDDTLRKIQNLKSPKIKIIETEWDFSLKEKVLSEQTNIALKACRGVWAFYLQSDEVVHEKDLPKILRAIHRYQRDEQVDALRFRWLHFYGSYYRYRIDTGWYQKQDRIVRNNGTIESFGDAFGFRRKDGAPLRRKNTGALLYHYGWVQSEEIMAQRIANADRIGYAAADTLKHGQACDYGDLSRFPVYFGSHPLVMKDLIAANPLSQQDWKAVFRRYWWNPALWFRMRYKTGRRHKMRL